MKDTIQPKTKNTKILITGKDQNRTQGTEIRVKHERDRSQTRQRQKQTKQTQRTGQR